MAGGRKVRAEHGTEEEAVDELESAEGDEEEEADAEDCEEDEEAEEVNEDKEVQEDEEGEEEDEEASIARTPSRFLASLHPPPALPLPNSTTTTDTVPACDSPESRMYRFSRLAMHARIRAGSTRVAERVSGEPRASPCPPARGRIGRWAK